jgi:lambda family phage portal protein
MVKLFGKTWGRKPEADTTPVINVADLDPFPAALMQAARADFTFFDGDKFYGGFGNTQLQIIDYWTLRQRSAQLFNENLYARGLIRRLVTNEINTGLNLEATPGDLTGMTDDDVRTDWSENVENRFKVWSKNPELCDRFERSTFGSLQRQLRREAIVTGDVLVVLHMSRTTGLPQIELVSGGLVQTPLGKVPRNGNEIKHGVEIDPRGRHVAYWVRQKDGNFKRVPAKGERSGRRLAWLVYGTDKRLDELRGQPILALILQSLKELDRYRDAEQRAAVINSMLAMYVEKTEDKPGSKPLSGGAVRRDTAAITDSDAKQRTFTSTQHIPGLVIEELQQGEKPVSHDTSRPNVNFGAFEASIAHALAWANEVPPEIYLLSFSSNYSASRGAVNEFKLYLDMSRMDRAEEFCEPTYQEWLVSEVIRNKVRAPGLLEARRDVTKYDVVGDWLSSDWAGAIKPSVDLNKEVSGYEKMSDRGWITSDRASRELSGTKFSKNVRRMKKENELLAEAIRPLLELKKEFGLAPDADLNTVMEAAAASGVESKLDDILDAVENGTARA